MHATDAVTISREIFKHMKLNGDVLQTLRSQMIAVIFIDNLSMDL